MFAAFIVLWIITLVSMRVHTKGLDEKYLSKEYTQAIKGFFILVVFLSHARQYAPYDSEGALFAISFLDYLGQFMVTLFLFYSGYRVNEAIKKKGNVYVNALPKNRIGKTFFDFAFAILLFYITGLIVGTVWPLPRVLLSLTGWTGIGNSNWYMFVIFVLYFLTYLCFKIFGEGKKRHFLALCLLSVLSFLYVYLMSDLQPSRFSNTFLCYVAGAWYSYFKEEIDKLFKKNNLVYYVISAIVVAAYLYTFDMRGIRLMYFNMVSILFCLCIVLLSCKISFKSKILAWCGEHLFWIYILQRIPMILLRHLGMIEYNMNLFLWISLAVTIVMAYLAKKYMDRLKDCIWKHL